jgi:ribosome-associated translation inhibitor RaiA
MIKEECGILKREKCSLLFHLIQSTMKIQIKYTSLEKTEKLQEYAEKKIESALKVVGKGERENALCFIELVHNMHKKTSDVYKAECTLHLEGNIYRLSKEEPTIEKAIDKIKDDLFQVVQKDKTQKKDKIIRGGLKLKERIQKEGE